MQSRGGLVLNTLLCKDVTTADFTESSRKSCKSEATNIALPLSVLGTLSRIREVCLSKGPKV